MAYAPPEAAVMFSQVRTSKAATKKTVYLVGARSERGVEQEVVVRVPARACNLNEAAGSHQGAVTGGDVHLHLRLHALVDLLEEQHLLLIHLHHSPPTRVGKRKRPKANKQGKAFARHNKGENPS
jgi:hypothetical protein